MADQVADIPEEVEAAAVATICLPLNNGEVAGLAEENDGATVHKLDEESTEDQVLEEMVTEGGIVPPYEVTTPPGEEEEDIWGRVAEDILANDALLANIAEEEHDDCGWVVVEAVVTQSYPLQTVLY